MRPIKFCMCESMKYACELISCREFSSKIQQFVITFLTRTKLIVQIIYTFANMDLNEPKAVTDVV